MWGVEQLFQREASSDGKAQKGLGPAKLGGGSMNPLTSDVQVGWSLQCGAGSLGQKLS